MGSKMITLVLPDTKYKKSYISAVREFQEEDNPNASNYRDLVVEELQKDFESYVERLQNRSKGIDLPEGFVSATEYWIIDGDKHYQGRLEIRHRLTEYLEKFAGHIGYNIRPSARRKGYASQALTLGLQKAKELGLTKVLITCNDDNIASIKVIEKHGAVLENKLRTDNGVLKRRYWIKIN